MTEQFLLFSTSDGTITPDLGFGYVRPFFCQDAFFGLAFLNGGIHL